MGNVWIAVLALCLLAFDRSGVSLDAELDRLAARADGEGENVVLYLHGKDQAGEVGLYQRTEDWEFHPMDASRPGAGLPRSQFVTNYLVGPPQHCGGNPYLPVWIGEVRGRIVGPVSVVLNTLATDSLTLRLSVFTDVNYDAGSSALCQQEVEPVATKDVVVPRELTQTEVRLDARSFRVRKDLSLQIGIAGLTPGQARLFYDSDEYLSRVSFACIPAKGRTSCVG